MKQGIKESPYPRLEPRGGSGVLADLILKAWLGQGRAKGVKAGGKF